MKVLLINVDSKIPNLALKKIEKYHIDKGDEIIWDFPLARYECDKIYVSCIFPENRHKCLDWEGCADIGGTGYDIKKRLPPEIESIKPRINWGFTTRGCIRKCHFCFVPEKEGNIHVVGDIYDIWDGESKELMIMDNNILALPEHFMKIATQLKQEKLKVDFNQGLDHRLLTKEIAEELLSLKHISFVRFAFDHISYKDTVVKALKILKECGLKDWKSRWYIYVGEKDTLDTVYQRIELIRRHKQSVYVMKDKVVSKNPAYIALTKWGNSPSGAFKSSLKDVFKKSPEMKRYLKHFTKLLKETHDTK